MFLGRVLLRRKLLTEEEYDKFNVKVRDILIYSYDLELCCSFTIVGDTSTTTYYKKAGNV